MRANPAAIQAIVDAQHGQPFQVLGPHAEPLAELPETPPAAADAEAPAAGAKPKGKGKSKAAAKVLPKARLPKVSARVFNPDARRLWFIESDSDQELAEAERTHEAGFFEAELGERDPQQLYRVKFETHAGHTVVLHDPYEFESLLSDFDLHLLREGTHLRNWEKLGAHLLTVRGVRGVHFSTWAPNATRVSVVGDFNSWDGRRHPMRHHEGNGLWEVFIPGLTGGETYKYELGSPHGGLMLKTDPYAFQVELPPQTASRVYELGGYSWKDQAWMEQRRTWNFLEKPISIYEMHFGSWRRRPEEGNRSLSYHEMAYELADYIKQMGYTHIELMPMTEHPFYGSWGYQTVNFFAPTGRYGDPKELMEFIDIMHQAGVGVLLDWVPAHFPTDAYGLAEYDGTHLYEHADPRQGRHPDWNTLVFNYGRTEVRNFLLSSALFWLEQYHFDGLRVDAVASMIYLDYSRKPGQWVPNRFGGKENLEAIDFLKTLNTVVHEKHPGVLTIAEESTSFTGVSRPCYLGGLGFSMKWNMGWMHDILEYFSKDPIYRKWHANKLTFSMLYAYSENFCLSLSHDEVVHGKGSLINKMPGDDWQKRANLRALFGFMYGHPGKKLHFMGSEWGQYTEWNHDGSLDWHLLGFDNQQGLLRWMQDLNHLYKNEPALYERDFVPEGFRWIDCSDAESAIYSFARFAANPDDHLIFVFNLTPVPRTDYRVGVPHHRHYREVLNSDAASYGGGNLGNAGGHWSDQGTWQGYDNSISLTLPPLSVVVLKPG